MKILHREKDSKWDDPYVKMSSTLIQAVKTAHQIDRTDRIIPHAKCLRLINEKDGVPLDRIERVLGWYCKTLIDGTSLHHANSTSMFRTKFGSIESLMKTKAEKPVIEQTRDAATRLHKKIREERPDRKTAPIGEISQVLWEHEQCIKAIVPKGSPDLKFVLGSDYAFSFSYDGWILMQVVEWDKWGGNLADFYPPKKHFMRWVEAEYGERDGLFLSDNDRRMIMRYNAAS